MAIITTDTLKFRESVSDSWKNLLIQANIDFNLIYPVGSIYMSVNNTDPSLLFGGTWEQLENRFLLGAGSSYTAGDTGGEASHTLTDSELPVEEGSMIVRPWGSGSLMFDETGIVSRASSAAAANIVSSTSTSGTGWKETIKFGGGQAHNNMPPYIVVYMWKRLTLAPHLPYPQNVLGDIAEVATAFSIPASGASISYNMVGITDEYELVKWNFSSSPENKPPVNLNWDTYDGYFTITNNGGTSAETIKPLFIKSKKVAITAR